LSPKIFMTGRDFFGKRTVIQISNRLLSLSSVIIKKNIEILFSYGFFYYIIIIFFHKIFKINFLIFHNFGNIDPWPTKISDRQKHTILYIPLYIPQWLYLYTGKMNTYILMNTYRTIIY